MCSLNFVESSNLLIKMQIFVCRPKVFMFIVYCRWIFRIWCQQNCILHTKWICQLLISNCLISLLNWLLLLLWLELTEIRKKNIFNVCASFLSAPNYWHLAVRVYFVANHSLPVHWLGIFFSSNSTLFIIWNKPAETTKSKITAAHK